MLDTLDNLERTHTCGELRGSHVGQQVILMGWVAKKRDFGPLIFVDLRDREGITQIVFELGSHTEIVHDSVMEDREEVFEGDALVFTGEVIDKAYCLKSEYVIAVEGTVVNRDTAAINSSLPTGTIEVRAKKLLVLNEAKVPPFQLEVTGSSNLADESTRLKYRYLDLRRPELQRNIRMRAKAVGAIREYFDKRGFIEIETPILLKSTPEGARDFVVPSRIHQGKFFALPQSPQLLKQLTMISGFDKYYQIARCFRDEDLRADRQPEFTQLDMEMSFVNREQVYREMEGMFNHVLRKAGDIELPDEWPRMTHLQAMELYGTDKPDLRFGMRHVDLTEVAGRIDFPPFAERGHIVKCIVLKGSEIPGVHELSRKSLDNLQEIAKRFGAGALANIRIGFEAASVFDQWPDPKSDIPEEKHGVVKSSLMNAIGFAQVYRLINASGAGPGDVVLIVAGKKSAVTSSLRALRNEVARRENLIDRSRYECLIVTEFPMFELDEEKGTYVAAHHPFTSPMDEDLELFKQAIENEADHHLLGQVRAKAYDAVINGYECAGGSIRIHQKEIQDLNFKALGMPREVARARFGFFLDALEYGTPPHGGFAAGIERTCMILCGTENIRDVMAFPKTASAQDLMMDAPGEVDTGQLEELGIAVEARE